MNQLLKMLLSIPRSLIVNIVLFGFEGYKIPLLISYKTKLKNVKRGCVTIENYAPFAVKYGIREGSNAIDGGEHI